MSLLILIDGYNVIAPVAAPGRQPTADWLERERRLLLDRLHTHLPSRTLTRCCVVFDAAGGKRSGESHSSHHGILVRFAQGYAEADDLIEELIAQHSSPKQLAVVSSDHRIQAAARQRGATVFESQAWLDDLMDGRVGLAPKMSARAGQGSSKTQGQAGRKEQSGKPEEPLDPESLADWMREFGFDES